MAGGGSHHAACRWDVNTEPSLLETCRQIAVLLSSALSFVAPERGEVMVRKWLGRCDIDEMSEVRMLAMSADAMLLSVDLLLSYPATSGTTALDRLARKPLWCVGRRGDGDRRALQGAVPLAAAGGRAYTGWSH